MQKYAPRAARNIAAINKPEKENTNKLNLDVFKSLKKPNFVSFSALVSKMGQTNKIKAHCRSRNIKIDTDPLHVSIFMFLLLRPYVYSIFGEID